MSNNLTPIDNTRAGIVPSQRMRDRMAQGRAISDNFSAGTAGGFHVLSIRASKFHLRYGDAEQTITDPATGYPVAFCDAVLVNASKQLAKTYYASAYQQGANEQPDCWSMDSIRPDPSVQKKINPTCGDCPMNAFGSRMTPAGKAAKACSDHRRVAICFPGELAKPDPTPILLRVPQSSLKAMRNYVDMLARHGYEPGGCITRMSFDSNASYPMLEFRFVGPLNDQEFSTVEQMMASPNINAMLTGARPEVAADDAPQGLQPLQRQAPITVGFSAGMLSQPEPEPEPVRQTQPAAAVLPEADVLIRLPDGKLYNQTKGVYVVDAPPKPELDPGIIKLPDGRFLHLASNTFVSSQFTNATEVPVHVPVPTPKSVPVSEPEEKKRTRRSKAEMEAARAAAEPATTTASPQEVAPQANGSDKPTVVTASPKLEQLLSGLGAKKNPQ